MSEVQLSPGSSPLACARVVLADLEAWAQSDPRHLPVSAKVELIQVLEQAAARLASIRLRLLGTADDVARSTGHRDAASWYAAATRTDVGAARAAQRTARGLTSAPRVARALETGAMSERHAATIIDALDRLPTTSAQLRRRAEERLVTHARALPPTQLAARGKGILDEVDPERAQHLGTTLADEASRAWAATTLTFRDRADGTTAVDGVLPTPVASRIRTVLHAFTGPRARRRAEKIPAVDGVPPSSATPPVAHATRMGQALCTLFERLDPADLPQHGGAATTVIVTIDRDQLTEELGTASLLGGAGHGRGTAISAGEARRLACGAGILPAVLDGASQVLDLGRRSRLFTAAQVTALRLQDGRCRAQGCTIPAAWCEAHHLRPWSRGGSTDLSNGVLLCSFHHHLVHDPTHHHEHRPDRTVQFERPPDGSPGRGAERHPDRRGARPLDAPSRQGPDG